MSVTKFVPSLQLLFDWLILKASMSEGLINKFKWNLVIKYWVMLLRFLKL